MVCLSALYLLFTVGPLIFVALRSAASETCQRKTDVVRRTRGRVGNGRRIQLTLWAKDCGVAGFVAVWLALMLRKKIKDTLASVGLWKITKGTMSFELMTHGSAKFTADSVHVWMSFFVFSLLYFANSNITQASHLCMGT